MPNYDMIHRDMDLGRDSGDTFRARTLFLVCEFGHASQVKKETWYKAKET